MILCLTLRCAFKLEEYDIAGCLLSKVTQIYSICVYNIFFQRWGQLRIEAKNKTGYLFYI